MHKVDLALKSVFVSAPPAGDLQDFIRNGLRTLSQAVKDMSQGERFGLI